MFKEKSSNIQDNRQYQSAPCLSDCSGKKNARLEFSAKLSVSIVDVYAFFDVFSWDSFHEGKRLRESRAEKYKNRYGYYPEAVLADIIYRTRENQSYCKERCIRLSGPNLGSPPKGKQVNATQGRIEKQDA